MFFALGILGLASEHFVFRDFVTGRAPPWPQGAPGREAFAFVTGALCIVVAAGMLTRRFERTSALVLAGSILLWAVLRHIPVVLASTPFASEWTRAGKALVLFGGALTVAASSRATANLGGANLAAVTARRSVCHRTAGILLGAFLVMTGIQHFLHTVFVASLIPAWFPGNATVWTYAAGVALIAGGIGMNVPRTTRTAALLVGLMVFSWFWIVHLPRTFASVSDGIAVFEALAVSGIAFMLAALPPNGIPPQRLRRETSQP